MHTIRRHPSLKADFEDAFVWYQDQRYGLGLEFAAAFRVALETVRRNPLAYARRLDDVRRFNLRRFPYGIFYFVEGDAIVILALLHGRRDINPLLRSRRQVSP